MSRKRKPKSISAQSKYEQLSLFDLLDKENESYEVLSRDEVANYNPVQKTANYMKQLVESQQAWETTIQKAREHLLRTDARQLYFDFFKDIKKQIEQDSSKSALFARLLQQVAIRGLGMTREQVRVDSPPKGSSRWKVNFDEELIQQHLQSHIVGEHFLNEITADETVWGDRTILIGASDVSQHRSAVPIPARFFTRSVPFLLNNAAAAIVRVESGKPSYDRARYNPQPNEELLRWMLIDPSYQEDLEPEDYLRCIASAMDVGQYKFDHQYLLNADRSRPDIILRDGSLFPQDAYLDNFLIENRRGEFTREAIREILSCLNCARDYGVIYCGVAKSVRLKIYSAVLEWYIAKHIDTNWEIGNYTLTDGQAMTLLLSSPTLVGDNLQQTLSTCLIRRSFTTRANLNGKANLNDLDSYFNLYQNRNELNIDPYKQLSRIFHVYMFFLGHSKTPKQLLPRYEFFHDEALGSISEIQQKIFSSIRYSALDIDDEHSLPMSQEPIKYIIPAVTLQAHINSKKVGELITDETASRIMSEYKNLLSHMVSNI